MADVIDGRVDYIDGEGRFLHSWRSPMPAQLLSIAQNVVMPLPQVGTLFKRLMFEALRGFDLRYKYSSDFDFFIRAKLSGGKFLYSNMCVAGFRVHGAQISQRKESEMRDESEAFLAANVSSSPVLHVPNT